jgi:hypothetical protein
MRLKNSLTFCPVGRDTECITDLDYLMGQWKSIVENNTYDGGNSLYWHQIRGLLPENRRVGMRFGRGEEYPRFFQAAKTHAVEALRWAEDNRARGVGAELIPCPP